jgi:hypothetical protein
MHGIRSRGAQIGALWISPSFIRLQGAYAGQEVLVRHSISASSLFIAINRSLRASPSRVRGRLFGHRRLVAAKLVCTRCPDDLNVMPLRVSRCMAWAQNLTLSGG